MYATSIHACVHLGVGRIIASVQFDEGGNPKPPGRRAGYTGNSGTMVDVHATHPFMTHPFDYPMTHQFMLSHDSSIHDYSMNAV